MADQNADQNRGGNDRNQANQGGNTANQQPQRDTQFNQQQPAQGGQQAEIGAGKAGQGGNAQQQPDRENQVDQQRNAQSAEQADRIDSERKNVGSNQAGQASQRSNDADGNR